MWRFVVLSFALGSCGELTKSDPNGCDGSVAPCVTDAATNDAANATSPSCDGLATTCGADGASSCCASPLVPGGQFLRGYDLGADGMYANVGNPATIRDFQLDKYEVTVGRFRRFVNAGLGTQTNPPPAGAGRRSLNALDNQGGWHPSWNGNLAPTTDALRAALRCNSVFQTWTDAPGNNETLPMTCLDWFQAMAFCAWDGGFLPTQAEQNYAASGGGQQRAFPWSNPPSSPTIDCAHANYYDSVKQCVLPAGGTRRVGSSPLGDGRWGHSDLAGNVDEWALDWYAVGYPTPCENCANLAPATQRVMGPGYWGDGASAQRAPRHVGVDPTLRTFSGGVRCARAPR